MGYRKIPTIHTLDEIEGETGLVVKIKSIKFGKVRRLMALADEDTDESLTEMFDQLLENLVSWNLEDEHGTPVPMTKEGLEDQETDFIMTILDSWIEKMTKPSADLGKDSSSGPQFPGRPVTMEVL